MHRTAALEAGYTRAYRNFYSWSNIARAALVHPSAKHRAEDFAYAAGWKKFEPLWDVAINARQLARMTPVLEAVLADVTRGKSGGGAGSGALAHAAGER